MDLKKHTFIQALKESFGNISKACKAVDVSRGCYYKWLDNDEEFKEEINNIDEYVIDEVENHLLKQIREGSTAGTIFYLKTKAKHRGYVEKQEIDHTTKGEKINVISLGNGVKPD